MVATPIALVLLWKKIRFEKAQVKLSGKTAVRVFLLNPAVWLLAALILLMFLG